MSTYQRKGKKYSKITFKKRMQLIDMIVNQGGSITGTSKKLHIKLPTAKAILASYRKHNHIFQRKKQNEGFVDQQFNIQSVHNQQNKIKIPEKKQKEKPIQIVPQTNQVYEYTYPMQFYYPNFPNMNLWAYYCQQLLPYQQ